MAQSAWLLIVLVIGTQLSCENAQTTGAVDLVVVPISQQLKDASDKVTTLGQNIKILSKNIETAIKYTEKAKEDVDTIVMQAKSAVRNYKVYVTLANNVAKDQDKAHCSSRSSEIVTEVEEQVSSKIDASALYYLQNFQDILKELEDIKLSLVNKESKDIIGVLEDCANNKTARLDQISKCLQWTAAAYKELVVSSSVKIATAYNKALFLKKTTGLKVLRSTVDTSVSLSSNDMTNYAEEILQCSGMSAKSILNSTNEKFDQVNATASAAIQLAINELKQLIRQTQKKMNSSFSGAEPQLNELVADIYTAITFITKRKPELANSLNAYRNRALDIVSESLGDLQAGLSQVRSNLDKIFDYLDTIYADFQAKITQSKKDMEACVPVKIEDRLTYTKSIKECTNKQLNVSVELSNNGKLQISKEKDKYSALDSVSKERLNFKVEFSRVKPNVADVVEEMLVKSGLSEQILLAEAQIKLGASTKNSSDYLSSETDHLKNSIAASLNALSIQLIKANEYKVNIEKLVGQAINFADKNAPEYVAELKQYLTDAQQLVSKFKTDAEPVTNQLQAIATNVGSILSKLQESQENVLENLKKCLTSENLNRLSNIDYVIACLHGYENVADSIFANAQHQFDVEIEKYQSLPDISPAYKANADLQEILRKIENTIDKIISEKNFDFDQMVERAKQEIDKFNSTYGEKIKSKVADLSKTISEALNEVKVKINEAEQLLSELIIYPIASTVRYSIDYAPDKVPELKTFYLHANEMLNNYIAKIKSDALPFSIQYQAILNQIKPFYPNLQEQFQRNKDGLSACKDERGNGRLGKVEAVDVCLNRLVNASRDAAKQTETSLANNQDLYLASGKVNITVEVDNVKKDVEFTTLDVLKLAGLTPPILLHLAQSAFADLKAKYAIPIEKGVKELKNNAQSMQNQISLEIENIDNYINKVLISISNTIKFAEKYSPNNVEPLKSYLNQTENLVIKIKTDLKPINPKLALIIDTIENLSTSLNSHIENSEDYATKCVNTVNPNPLHNIEEVRKCLDKQVNSSKSLAEQIKSTLGKQYDTFNYISQMASYVTGNLSSNLGSIFNGVNEKVDFIIEQEKLAPEVQLQTSLENLQVLNLSAGDTLSFHIQSLHNDITNTKNRLGKDLSAAEQSLNEANKPVSDAITFATKYEPYKTAELNAYKTKADELVFAEMLKLKIGINPALIELDDIYFDSGDIIGNLQNKIDLANKSLSACSVIKESDKLTRIESVKLCLNTHINVAVAATDEAQAKLQRETERFQSVSNTKLVVDLDPIRANVKTIVDSVLTAAGLNDAEILNRAREEIAIINKTNIDNTYPLLVAAQWLKDSFAQIDSQTVMGTSDIESYLKNTINIIEEAIDFAKKYGSDKIQTLKALINNVTMVANVGKAEIQSIHPKIDNSIDRFSASIVTYLAQYKNISDTIGFCAETDIVDRIVRAENIMQCAKLKVESLRSAMSNLREVFYEEHGKYYAFAANVTNLINSVKKSFNETITLVDKILDDLIASAGLSPESQLNKGLLSLTSIQVTGNPNGGSEELRNAIIGHMKDVDAVLEQAEITLRKIPFTDEAINYAIEYQPNKTSELNTLRAEKDELLESVINDVKNKQNPIREKLQQMLQTISDNNATFQETFNDIHVKLRGCINTSVDDELDRLEAIDTCIHNYLRIARNVSENATQVLLKQIQAFKELANVSVSIDINKVVGLLQNINHRAFEIAGLVPEILLKEKLQELIAYNETAAKDLNRGIENLSRNILETQDELTSTLGVADKYLSDITINVTLAIDFAAKFAPEKISDFQGFINEAQKIVLKAKTDIQPAKIQLQSIQNIINTIYPDLQSRLNQTRMNILDCPSEDAFKDLSDLIAFNRCLNTNYDISLNAGKVSKERLIEEEKKFDLIDNVSAALNASLNANFDVVVSSIVKKAGEVIMTYGLTPEALERKGLEQIERVRSQVSSTLRDGIQDLQLSVNQTLNQIQKAVNNSEKALNQAVKVIGIAIDYAAEYSPEKATELDTFRGKANEIVSSIIQEISNSLTPVYNKLNSVLENKDDILNSFQSKIDQAKKNISLCAAEKTEDKYERVENTQLCIKRILSIIVDEANSAQRGVYDRYEKYRSIGNISIKTDTDAASKRAALVVTDVLKTVGLTSEQLQNKTFHEISSINDTVAVSLLDEISKLKNSVANLQTQTTQAVKTAEAYLENTTKFIQEAKEFILQHSPDRLPELESLFNQAQLLLVKVKADAQPEEAQLQAIYNTAGLIYDNFQQQVDGTKASANTCENNNSNQLEQVSSVRNCLGSYVNTIISAANNANGQLNNEIKKFNVVANSAYNVSKNISSGFEKQIAGVKKIVDSIVAGQQLSPGELYNKTVNQLKYINESIGNNILAGVDELKSDILRTNNDINDRIAIVKTSLDEAVKPIELGIQELVKYAFEKTAELIAFRERAREIKENAVTNLEMNIQPTKTLLQSIYHSLSDIYSGLNSQLELSKANVDRCYANQKINYLENIEYLRECFDKELNESARVANKREISLKNEFSKYKSIRDISLILTVDFGSINVVVNSTVDEMRRVSGLTPEGLLLNTKTQVDIILSNNGSAVRNDIVNVLNFVASRQNEIQAAAKNAEIQMKQEVQPVEGAINFAGKYAPDRVTQLNNYLNSGQELVVNNINKLNADVQPSIYALANTSSELNEILRKYDTEVATIKETLKQCIEIDGVDTYNNIPVIQNCFKNFINKTNTAVKTAQEYLDLLTQKFSTASNSASSVVANIDLQPLTRSVQQVINDIFDTAGFTLAELPKKLVIELQNEFDKEVSGDKLRSQELTKDVVGIAEKYVNSFNKTLDWSLEPIKNAIETIKYVNPNYNTNDLNNQWRLLYDQMKGAITDYIESIQRNATDHNDLAVGFNLNDEFSELQQNIVNCIKRYTNAYLPYISDCIDPLIRDFHSHVTNALSKTRTIVDEIEIIKTTAPKLIEEFINKTAERARVNASVKAEEGKAIAAITPNEQIKRFLVELDELKKNGINVFITDINGLIKNVKNGNLSAFIDLTAKLEKAAEPWLYAINITTVNNPSKAAELSSQLPIIKKIVEDAKQRIKNELAQFIIDAADLENKVKVYQNGVNSNLTKFNAQLILSRCSPYNVSVTLFADCVRNITGDLYKYLRVVQPELNSYLDSAVNISKNANAAINNKITLEFNATKLLSLNEGGKVIQAYNISNNQILIQSLQSFKSYNITPIQLNIISIRSFVNRINSRTQDMVTFANYTLRSATYVINDAIGSAIFILLWRKTFTAERDEGIRIATEAANKVLATIPDFTSDIRLLQSTANRMNDTLEFEISKLEPAQLSVSCPMTMEYYDMYKCLLEKVDAFGMYYTPALKESHSESSKGFSSLSNITIILNKWRDDVIYTETAGIVNLMKPLAHALFINNNIKIDQLLGYALYIIRNKYSTFNQTIPSAADNLKVIANRILAKNYTGRVNLSEAGNLLLKPVTDTLLYLQSTNLYHLLNETDLQIAHTLFYELNYKLYNVFYANFTIQAQLAIQLAYYIQADVERTYIGLDYNFLYNTCYDEQQAYPLVEMVNCYIARYSAFSVYLTNSLKNLTMTASVLLSFDMNEEKIVNDYVNNKLLPEFRQICVLVAIELYKKVGLKPPAEYLAMVTKKELCRVGIITDKFTCIITQ